jgi:hypothetical protein
VRVKAAVDVVSEGQIFAFVKLMPRHDYVCRTEIVWGRIALDGHRFIPARGRDEVYVVGIPSVPNATTLVLRAFSIKVFTLDGAFFQYGI